MNLYSFFLFLPYKFWTLIILLLLYNHFNWKRFSHLCSWLLPICHCGWQLLGNNKFICSLFLMIRSYTGQMTPKNPWLVKLGSAEMSQPKTSQGWKLTPSTLLPWELTTLLGQGPQAPQSMGPPRSLVSIHHIAGTKIHIQLEMFLCSISISFLPPHHFTDHFI